jgi:hypothetical protein
LVLCSIADRGYDSQAGGARKSTASYHRPITGRNATHFTLKLRDQFALRNLANSRRDSDSEVQTRLEHPINCANVAAPVARRELNCGIVSSPAVSY